MTLLASLNLYLGAARALNTDWSCFLRGCSYPSSVAKVGPHFQCILFQCVMEKWMKKMEEIVGGKKTATGIMFCGYVTITALYNLTIASSKRAGLLR